MRMCILCSFWRQLKDDDGMNVSRRVEMSLIYKD